MHDMYSIERLCGIDDELIDYESLEVPVHCEVVAPFLALRERGLKLGFDLAIASGYRSFERQQKIWNDKLTGLRPTYDNDGCQLDLTLMQPWEQVLAVLRWSALPGTSRHHWGTDLDIYDRAAVPSDYPLQLSPAEVAAEGPFGPLHAWLDELMDQQQAEGFYRPYAQDRGGVAPERWHLSLASIAEPMSAALDTDRLRELIRSKPLVHKQLIAERLEEVLERFVCVTGP